MIEPVERDCTCPPPERKVGEHDRECEDAYRAKFVASWRRVRLGFYASDGRN